MVRHQGLSSCNLYLLLLCYFFPSLHFNHLMMVTSCHSDTSTEHQPPTSNSAQLPGMAQGGSTPVCRKQNSSFIPSLLLSVTGKGNPHWASLSLGRRAHASLSLTPTSSVSPKAAGFTPEYLQRYPCPFPPVVFPLQPHHRAATPHLKSGQAVLTASTAPRIKASFPPWPPAKAPQPQALHPSHSVTVPAWPGELCLPRSMRFYFLLNTTTFWNGCTNWFFHLVRARDMFKS